MSDEELVELLRQTAGAINDAVVEPPTRWFLTGLRCDATGCHLTWAEPPSS